MLIAMKSGGVYPPESRNFHDDQTGTRIRQVTDHASIHHHPFYYIPTYDDAMCRLYFISHRTGRPEIFAEDCQSGQLIQLTGHDNLAEYSIHPSHDGRYVYFTDDTGAWRVETDTFKEECLINFGQSGLRESGMVGAAMGTTTLSRCDRWWAVPVKMGPVSRMVVIDTRDGSHKIILERDMIGHPQFHPDDANLLRYAGPYDQRMWTIERDGSNNRLAYSRDLKKKTMDRPRNMDARPT